MSSEDVLLKIDTNYCKSWAPIARGQGCYIQFVVHLIVDAISVQLSAGCIYLDLLSHIHILFPLYNNTTPLIYLYL